MYLDEFNTELARVMWDLDCGRRSEERAIEIVWFLIDDFSARFTSRDDIARYAANKLAAMHYECSKRCAAEIRRTAKIEVGA